MPQEFLDLLKSYGLDWATLTDEQRTKAQQIWDNHQKQKNPPPPKPEPKPGDASGLSAEDRERLGKLEGGLTELATALKSVTDFVTAQNQSATERAKAEREQRYTTAVEKAVTEGRLTRAKADEYLKPESRQQNIAGLEVFEKMLSDMPVDKALAQGEKKTETPAKQEALVDKPISELRNAARDAAAARFSNQES